MILVRDVFQAKYGKAGALVALFEEAREKWPAGYARGRILTDRSGRFFTVVTETEVEDLGAWERQNREVMAMPAFAGWFERMTDLVESGQREFYTIEA